jgi:hypothetical protein
LTPMDSLGDLFVSLTRPRQGDPKDRSNKTPRTPSRNPLTRGSSPCREPPPLSRSTGTHRSSWRQTPARGDQPTLGNNSAPSPGPPPGIHREQTSHSTGPSGHPGGNPGQAAQTPWPNQRPTGGVSPTKSGSTSHYPPPRNTTREPPSDKAETRLETNAG